MTKSHRNMPDPLLSVSHFGNAYQDFPEISHDELLAALAIYKRKQLVKAPEKLGWLVDRGAILMPYWDPSGRFLGYRARKSDGAKRWADNIDSQGKWAKHPDACLYHLPEVADKIADTLYLVGGESDTATMIEAAYPNTAGIFEITNVPENLAEILAGWHVRRVITIFNAVTTGEHARRRVSALLTDTGIVVDHTSTEWCGCNDVSEMWVALGGNCSKFDIAFQKGLDVSQRLAQEQDQKAEDQRIAREIADHNLPEYWRTEISKQLPGGVANSFVEGAVHLFQRDGAMPQTRADWLRELPTVDMKLSEEALDRFFDEHSDIVPNCSAIEPKDNKRHELRYFDWIRRLTCGIVQRACARSYERRVQASGGFWHPSVLQISLKEHFGIDELPPVEYDVEALEQANKVADHTRKLLSESPGSRASTTKRRKRSSTKPRLAIEHPSDNMREPGVWYARNMDPQAVYWQMIRLLCKHYGWQVDKERWRLIHTSTGREYTNPDKHVLRAIVTAGFAPYDEGVHDDPLVQYAVSELGAVVGEKSMAFPELEPPPIDACNELSLASKVLQLAPVEEL